MLTCVYHPIQPMQVVEEDEAEKMLASGFWFDSPKLAEDYRLKVEKEIAEEKELELEASKQRKGKKNER